MMDAPASSALSPDVPRAALASIFAGILATPNGRTLVLRALRGDDGQGSTRGEAVYRTLVVQVLRLTFLRHAEARGLIPPATLQLGIGARVRALHERHGGDLFDPRAHPMLGTLADGALADALAILNRVEISRANIEHFGATYEALLGFTVARTDDGEITVVPDGSRRRSGSHYTPRALAGEMVRRTLGPLVSSGTRADALRVCDPAMGAGGFLLEAARYLSGEVGNTELVVRGCLYGVDCDPLAVCVARHSLWLLAGNPALPFSFLDAHLRCGDATVGDLPEDGRSPKVPPERSVRARAFDWPREFQEIFARGGFDAVVGNPPWVSYAGRAAQPLEPAIKDYYTRASPAFGRYRNLQGVFAHRAAVILRPGGRLGLLLPSSMAFQDGYGPTRRAHDALSEPDDPLPFYGEESFAGVFQPCMGLLSTRRAGISRVESPSRWPLEEGPMDPGEATLLATMDALPRFPPTLFGERGFQTSRHDVSRLREYSPTAPAGLRCGTDVQPFRAAAPSYSCDPSDFGRRFRPASEWATVRILIRQTARWPIAALADGIPFRNSVLAGFADDTYDPHFLLGYLNSGPLRLYHYRRQRDARQGMPQLKVGHLRALPAPRRACPEADAVASLGARFAQRNTGISPGEQRELDDRVGELLGLDERARVAVRAWCESNANAQKLVGSPARAQSAVPAR